MLWTKLLMKCSRLPASPSSTRWRNLRLWKPRLGLESLKGQSKLLASLKCGPTVTISWRSSTNMIPCFLPDFREVLAGIEDTRTRESFACSFELTERSNDVSPQWQHTANHIPSQSVFQRIQLTRSFILRANVLLSTVVMQHIYTLFYILYRKK